jgi:hypothetical protein
MKGSVSSLTLSPSSNNTPYANGSANAHYSGGKYNHVNGTINVETYSYRADITTAT